MKNKGKSGKNTNILNRLLVEARCFHKTPQKFLQQIKENEIKYIALIPYSIELIILTFTLTLSILALKHFGEYSTRELISLMSLQKYFIVLLMIITIEILEFTAKFHLYPPSGLNITGKELLKFFITRSYQTLPIVLIGLGFSFISPLVGVVTYFIKAVAEAFLSMLSIQYHGGNNQLAKNIPLALITIFILTFYALIQITTKMI